MKEQFLKVAIVCGLIGETIPVSAFAAGSSEDSIVNDPNNQVYIERTAYADSGKASRMHRGKNSIIFQMKRRIIR